MSIPFIDLNALHAPIRDEIDAAISAVLDSGQFIRGPWVERFEEEIADYLGCKHAIGVSSGSDALLASLMALEIGEGDEVITTPFTFCATAEAILRVGATPVFVDIDPRTFNIDPDLIEDAVTDATRAILPVHLYGQCARMDRIMDIAERHDLYVVEDAAQAIGARFRDQMAGTIGHTGCFSFFPTKNLGALGDGGLITTNDDALAEEIRLVCNHGNRPKYNQIRVGGNFRLDAIQAAVLSVKLPYLDEWNEQRRENAARYDEALAEIEGVEEPFVDDDCRHIYNQYTLSVSSAAATARSLANAGIGHARYYPKPLHQQDAFAPFAPIDHNAFSCASSAADAVLSLPIAPCSPPATTRIVHALVESLEP
jgi:dTDP-4-amino-4,6-dideoxygalactose transaminase